MRRILTVGLLAACTVVSVGSVGADMFIYPKKGQSKDQQQKDQYECHLWAVDQTGVDPMKPAQPAPATAHSGGGEVVHGAAKGAALGAIGGAIAGDAGKGAAIGGAVGAAGGTAAVMAGGRNPAVLSSGTLLKNRCLFLSKRKLGGSSTSTAG